MNAACFTRGTTSLRSSKRFDAVSSSKRVTPVALPPGLARLAASPRRMGSALLRNTIGIAFGVAVENNKVLPRDVAQFAQATVNQLHLGISLRSAEQKRSQTLHC